MRTLAAAVVLVSLSVPLSAVEAPETLDGRWIVLVETENGERRESSIEFTRSGDAVRAVYRSSSDERIVIENARYAEGKLTFSVTRTIDGNEREISFRGEATGKDRIAGIASIGDRKVATVVMERQARPVAKGNPVGKWNVRALAPDGGRTYESVLEVSVKGDRLAGTVTGERGRLDIKSIARKGEGLLIKFDLPLEDQTVPIEIAIRFDGADRLVGRWSVPDSEFSGEWTAARVAAPAAKKEPAKPAVKPAAVAGQWRSSTVLDDGRELRFTIELRRGDDGRLAGRIVMEEYTIDLKDVRLEGDKLSYVIEREQDGETSRIEVAGTIAGKKIAGRWRSQDGSQGEWSGRKVIIADL